MLPPGRARLATKPALTGSLASAITIGIVVVACFAAATLALSAADDDIHLEADQLGREAQEAARSGPPPTGDSMTRFRPST